MKRRGLSLNILVMYSGEWKWFSQNLNYTEVLVENMQRDFQ
jgi:hypothetical protein